MRTGARSIGSRPTRRSCCATRRARTSTARCATSRACATRGATSSVSCPIPSTRSTSSWAARATGCASCARSRRRSRWPLPDLAIDVTPTVDDALALGLTAAEYELICEKHGGAPNVLELAMYSLMWSEHCAYKHSRKLLRTLPTEGEHVVVGPGENAGAVDVGGGLACAFKVESHNHPSAVDPFQGAATGVGGIIRDIFALGARPIAVLDSLRFGEPSGARARYLLEGAVSGIAHYGNSIGVPTVGGEVYFEAPYEHNCLINVMALGLARREQLVRSAAAGAGNALVLPGAATGRDGIGGASVLASSELDSATSGAEAGAR